jgi:hypothetical protein
MLRDISYSPSRNHLRDPAPDPGTTHEQLITMGRQVGTLKDPRTVVRYRTRSHGSLGDVGERNAVDATVERQSSRVRRRSRSPPRGWPTRDRGRRPVRPPVGRNRGRCRALEGGRRCRGSARTRDARVDPRRVGCHRAPRPVVGAAPHRSRHGAREGSRGDRRIGNVVGGPGLRLRHGAFEMTSLRSPPDDGYSRSYPRL